MRQVRKRDTQLEEYEREEMNASKTLKIRKEAIRGHIRQGDKTSR